MKPPSANPTRLRLRHLLHTCPPSPSPLIITSTHRHGLPQLPASAAHLLTRRRTLTSTSTTAAAAAKMRPPPAATSTPPPAAAPTPSTHTPPVDASHSSPAPAPPDDLRLPALLPPAPSPDNPTTTTQLQVDGQAVALDHLGPMVVARDGTLARIANWAELGAIERANTLRVLGKRNRERLAALRDGQQQASGEGGGGEAV